MKREYLIEAVGLGCFMLVACVTSFVLHENRAASALLLAGTAFALTTSPWGQRSGAHFNPAVTLTFTRLGKVAPRDAAGYVLAQFAGALLGLGLAFLLAGKALRAVDFLSLHPASHPALAFVAEFALAMGMMLTVLTVSNSSFHRHTPGVAAWLLATYLYCFAPVGLNPARCFASAFWAGDLRDLWIYLLAPLAGMLAAGWLYRGPVACAKLHHLNDQPCLFRCAFGRKELA